MVTQPSKDGRGIEELRLPRRGSDAAGTKGTGRKTSTLALGRKANSGRMGIKGTR